MVDISIKDPLLQFHIKSCFCCFKTNKVQKGIIISNESEFPDEFLEKVVEFTREDEMVKDNKKEVELEPC